MTYMYHNKGIYELERLCGKQWFNNNTVRDGLKGHLSPMYKIADY
jgi:hypothetical protein